MHLTQKRILAYLQEHSYASASELAGVFNMTLGNIRHHLHKLITSQLVELMDKQKQPGRGRSTYLYQVKPGQMEHNLDGLIEAVLEVSLANLAEPQQVEFLKRLAMKLATSQPTVSGHLSRRLTRAVQFLNEKHYQARWEAHVDAPHLYFHHCPYFQILKSHPELCQMDRFLVEELTGLSATQTTQIGPSRSCLFLIHSLT